MDPIPEKKEIPSSKDSEISEEKTPEENSTSAVSEKISSKKRMHLYVSGKVQGVFFRAHTQREALDLKLTGWVKNLRDGRVEVLAEGEEWALESLKKWCQKGPSLAYVVEIEVEESEYSGEFSQFKILY